MAFRVFTFIFFFLFGSLLYSNGKISERNPSKVNVCLTLFVKDDDAVINQCLKSVENTVDFICVFDLGSTDQTLSIVENFLIETGISGRIFQLDWENYEYNRNLGVLTAQMILREKKQNLTDWYLLMLEPEMQLSVDPQFNKSDLVEDAYFIRECSYPLSYCNNTLSLIRASLPWKCKGALHESWECGKPFEKILLNTLKIEELESGAFTEKKLYSKVEVLTPVLEQGSKEPHLFFHLGQVQKGLKNYEEALHLFQKRIELGEDKEEVWFSKYMIGDCYEKMGAWDKALFFYLESYQSDPSRLEPLQKIATYYRLHGKNELACLFAKHGALFPLSQQTSLTTYPPLSDYQFDEELSIAAFYTSLKNEGYDANDKLVLRKNVPWYIKSQAYNNHLFYVSPLPNARYQSIFFDLPLIEEDCLERYHPMNPSIQKTDEGYKVICRAVNYTQKGAKIFNTIQKNGVFRTKNFLLNYTKEFKLNQHAEIIENLNRVRYPAFNIEGLEDCRIFNFRNRDWFTCTTFDTNPTGTIQISLCQLSDQQSAKTIFVDYLVPLEGPNPYRCEKNWLPFVQNDQMYVVYSYDPFIIYRLDPETGKSETVLSKSYDLDLSSFRGSAAPIPFDQGYLLLVHEVVYLSDYSRSYLHRFLFLDEEFKITKISKPFYFQHQGIEFCSSMVLNHAENQLVLGVGSEDREAFLCFLPVETVRSLLKALPRIL